MTWRAAAAIAPIARANRERVTSAIRSTRLPSASGGRFLSHVLRLEHQVLEEGLVLDVGVVLGREMPDVDARLREAARERCPIAA
jgi:hypothetical protein